LIPLIERYILRRAAYLFLMTLCALVAALWVTQVLREIDVVTAQGQAIWIFLLMTVLALPALVQLVAPIAFLVAAIGTLNSLRNDSELPVIAAAGASRKAVYRPILVLGAIVMLLAAVSHHMVAPASLAALRAILTQVRVDVIATLVQEGGFRAVGDGLTMHIREKAADGSFRGIFVNDDRNPRESLQYSAADGLLLEQAGGSYFILQNGDLIREDETAGETNVVAFETYALDLSQLGAADGTAVYRARERSTLYLLQPDADNSVSEPYAAGVTAEIHSRTTAPLYALVFALLALAFLGRPATHRQDRSTAIFAVVALSILFRAGGFAALAVARNHAAAIPALYAIPLSGIALGAYVALQDRRHAIPRMVEAAWDAALAFGRRTLGRYAAAAGAAGNDSR